MTTKTKIILLAIALITAIATIFAAMYKPKRSDSIIRPVVKITAQLPLSGENQHIGLAAQQAIQNSLKQTDSNNRYKYEINYIDQTTANNIQDEQAIIQFTIAPDPRAILTLAETSQTPFIIHTPFEDLISSLEKELASKNIKNIGFITIAQGDYYILAQKLNQALSPKYQFRGAVFKKGQTDFSAILNMLINNDTDYYIISGTPTETDKLIKALHDRGINNQKIIALHSPDLSNQPELYNNIEYIGSEAGQYDGGLLATALLSIVESYEKNFIKEQLPNQEIVSQYLKTKKASDNIIRV